VGASSPATGGASASRANSRTAAGVQGSLPFATNCPVSSTLVPSCGAYWGIYSRRFGNRDVATSVTTWESMLGRKFDIVLMYYDFSNRNGPGRFPDPPMTQLSEDRIPLYDWETRDYAAGTYLRWADVAAGRYDDSVVIPQAQRLKAYGKPVMLSLDHEMDISYPRHGSAADYRAMYRHVRDVFAAQGVHNVVWVWDVTGWLGGDRGALVKSFYPGDDLVDWIGYDQYNSGMCKGGGWKTFEQTISKFYQWSEANGLGSKPLMLQEYGLTPDPADVAASQQWYRDIPSVLQRYPRLKALVRWDSDTGCTLRIDAGEGMLQAFKQAGLAMPRP
jgi:Glycosyl hydrolase family 26